MSKLSLRIPDFDRDVHNPHFKGWVPALSFSIGNSQPGSASRIGGQSSQPIGKEGSLAKKVDALSPTLFNAVASGRHVDELVIFQEGFPPGSALAMIVFGDVICVSYANGRSEDGDPAENFDFSYRNLAYMSQAQYLGLKGGAAALYNLASWFQ